MTKYRWFTSQLEMLDVIHCGQDFYVVGRDNSQHIIYGKVFDTPEEAFANALLENHIRMVAIVKDSEALRVEREKLST